MINEIISCLNSEAKTLINLADKIDDSITPFIDTLSLCKGKRCFLGVGKSQLVAQKIASSFSSLGYASINLDPLMILHGDLGFLSKDDIIIAISNSGETDVLISAIKHAQSLGVEILSISGNCNSTLAKMSSHHVLVKTEEAGPFGIVPSSTTTAVMALGDALLCGLAKRDELTINDFLRFHPGGEIGKNH